MKQRYNSIFLTNIPSFYKLNLYNEINKKKRILVVFTGDIIQERKKDFFEGEYFFDYVDMSKWNILRKIYFILTLNCKFKYDELVIGGWDSLPLLLAPIFSPVKKNACVVESSYHESKTSGIKGIVKKSYFKRISKVYASGKSQCKLVKKLNPKIHNIKITKGVGIFNIVKQPIFQKKNEIKNFIYVGRLEEEKNLKILVEVFSELPSLHLNILGYGSMYNQLKQLASPYKNIQFLGSIKNKILYSVYQNNDVFILPSSREPWGLVVEEALNNGLPIILSDRVGCAEEILQENVNGFLFVYNDKDSLVNVINKIVKPEVYNKLSKNVSQLDFEKIRTSQIQCYL